MPSIDVYKRRMSMLGMTTGQAHKTNSDLGMDMTWNNCVGARRCYIYDYAHDDQPDKYYGMTYENTTKYATDIKFIVTRYGTVDKDQVEYHIQFRPSQKVFFQEDDELYYFETDYRKKYGNDTFIGMYCDIPDDNGVYYKWLICGKEIGNQFIKYSVLPVTYQFKWIERSESQATKRKMWGVLRQQNSYSSGLNESSTFVLEDNKNKIWLPLNRITEKIWYVNPHGENTRLIVSAPTDNPIVWQISKCENVQPFGIQKLVCKQVLFDPNTDYIERNDSGEIVGMWADYFLSGTEPTDSDIPAEQVTCKITASTSTLKIGGSYRLLTVNLYDSQGNEVTKKYLEEFQLSCWSCSVDDSGIAEPLDVFWLEQDQPNKIKVKIGNNRDYLGAVIKIICTVKGVAGELLMEIVS